MANIYTIVDTSILAMDGLYEEIAQLEMQLEEELDSNGGELTPIAEDIQAELTLKQAELKTIQEGSAQSLASSIDEWGGWLRNIQSDVESLKKEENRLAAKRRAREKKAEWIKSNILFGMNALGQQKVAGVKFNASVRNSTSLEVDENTVLAPLKQTVDEFMSYLSKYPWISFTPKINKTIAKQQETLPEGFTQVVNQSLTIR